MERTLTAVPAEAKNLREIAREIPAKVCERERAHTKSRSAGDAFAEGDVGLGDRGKAELRAGWMTNVGQGA